MKKLFNLFSIKVLSLVFALLVFAFESNAQNKSTLKVGETLKPSEKLISPDGKFEFLGSLQLSGRPYKNLWQYHIINQTSNPSSSLPSINHGTLADLKLEEKGSLVLYNTEGKVMWSSASDYPNVSELRLQNDGNLVIYDTNDELIWALKDPKTGKYDNVSGNGFFIKYKGTEPDPSRLSSQTVNLDDLDKKN